MSLTWILIRTVLLAPWLGYLCYTDAKERRLPNRWTLGGFVVGLVVATLNGGWNGFVDALAAAGVGVLFLLLPVLLKQAFAGDLKMLAACGAFLGMKAMPLFLMTVSLAGLLVMLWMVIVQKATTARLKHLFRSMFDWRYDRKAGKATLPPKDDERVRVPFGIAIALGTLATLAVQMASAVK